MEKDVNLIIDITIEEAEKLIKLIEFLINDWYIKRHDTQKLCGEIKEISDKIDSLKPPRHDQSN